MASLDCPSWGLGQRGLGVEGPRNTSRLPGRVSLGLLKKGVRVLKGSRRLAGSLALSSLEIKS